VHGLIKELSSTGEFLIRKRKRQAAFVEKISQLEEEGPDLKKSKRHVVLMPILTQLVIVTVQHGQKDRPSLMFFNLLLMSRNGSRASPKLGELLLRMVILT